MNVYREKVKKREERVREGRREGGREKVKISCDPI